MRAGQSVFVSGDTKDKDRLLVTTPACALTGGLVCCLIRPSHSWSCPGVRAESSSRDTMQGVRAGSSCRDLVPGVL